MERRWNAWIPQLSGNSYFAVPFKANDDDFVLHGNDRKITVFLSQLFHACQAQTVKSRHSLCLIQLKAARLCPTNPAILL
jgi:hypothetical protein